MKGHAVLIEATRRLAAAGRRLHVVLVGTGPFEPSIRRDIAAAGLGERIALTGFVADMPGAMAALDVGVYSALESEGMSRVVFEYLATGTPIVASRVGVVPEVLEDDRTALLVPADEPGDLAAALARLLDDGALRARIGAAGAALARGRLSGAAVARALGGLYARLAADGHGRGP
jgi:glycosyltransferase involved in cell wall biosynthesis